MQEQLQNNPDIQNYFKDYNEQSVKQFITSYSVQKSYWYQYGELHTQLQEKHDLKWIEEAWWHLEAIQQKKLFDIHCLWRAEQIELPGIQLCVDISFWQENVLNCPFIDPITEAEVDLYREYLSQGEVELKYELTFCYFQDYDGIKEAYLSEGEEGSHYFAWYEFYNSRKGTAHYMNLLDIRGDKEASYITLARSTNPEKAAAIAAMKAAFTHSPDEPYIDRDGRELLNAYSPETFLFCKQFRGQANKRILQSRRMVYP